ncbi:hypothetical protein JOD69_003411 [Methylocaldum sp. RMAD-M]|jgi:hypothetical protein|nr:hypothetical protein [Methylocaldum sp. RMAD-M]
MFRTDSGCFEGNRGILIRNSSADQTYFLVTADVDPEQGCSPYGCLVGSALVFHKTPMRLRCRLLLGS